MHRMRYQHLLKTPPCKIFILTRNRGLHYFEIASRIQPQLALMLMGSRYSRVFGTLSTNEATPLPVVASTMLSGIKSTISLSNSSRSSFHFSYSERAWKASSCVQSWYKLSTFHVLSQVCIWHVKNYVKQQFYLAGSLFINGVRPPSSSFVFPSVLVTGVQ